MPTLPIPQGTSRTLHPPIPLSWRRLDMARASSSPRFHIPSSTSSYSFAFLMKTFFAQFTHATRRPG